MYPDDYISVPAPKKSNTHDLRELEKMCRDTTCLTLTSAAPIRTFDLAKDLGFNRVLVEDYLIHLDWPLIDCHEKVFVRKW